MHYLDVASEIGFDPHPTLANVGLSPDMFENQDQTLQAEVVVRLLEQSAAASGCETYGLRMAEPRNISALGAVSLLVSQQRTLKDVLNTIISYRQLVNEALAIHMENAGKSTILRQEIVIGAQESLRQATELAIAVLFLTCRSIFGTRWRPSSVNFSHPAPASLRIHRRVFQCPVSFGSDFNGIVLPTEILEISNPLTDPVMATYARQFIETMSSGDTVSTVQEVRKSIHILLPMGSATIEQVAKLLAFNVRSLQRRLDENGETFVSLINEVRREQALRFMKDPSCALGHISEQLGYSNPSSFTRWFATQFGVTPARWRATQGIRYRRGVMPQAVLPEPRIRRAL
ncbi:AraC family transcriptional regulator [Rhodanobacter sp. Soil772]|uniref:AraC family transcriptional regulator n=1 Tax=Rhodanobacter sp. Soil772 TaxID=1736406 RepID=UPI0009EA4D58|nr:AraC family transcriptional regulator [Rhodanobacter sp. Soil772]